ncbi:MAG: hypothetical protein KBT02_05950 [Treponema sp.]|nr:hypothetical protein [Candidatus Treponema caballi]
MINTYNESDLHNTLKHMYTMTYGGHTEVSTGKYVCDVVTDTGDVIEIQTANLGKLYPKIRDLLESHKVTLVYPLVVEKTIELTDEGGGRISRRKSPKRPNIYSMFDELTGLYPILLHPGFTLEVLSVSVVEHRMRTAEPVQLVNKSRRFRKNWIKTGKSLGEIKGRRTFTGKEDYLALLPASLPESFCANDLIETEVGKKARIMLWVFRKMNLVTLEEKRGRCNYYRKTR